MIQKQKKAGAAQPKKPAARKPSAKASAKASAKKRVGRKKTVGANKKDGRDRTGDSKLDVETVIVTLQNVGGIILAAAQHLKCSRTTLYKFIEDHPEVFDALEEIEEEKLDIGESHVVKALNSGDMHTVRWFMELKGRGRGYVRRNELTGKGGGPLETRQAPDLSNLSDEELEILKKAAEKREAEAGVR